MIWFDKVGLILSPDEWKGWKIEFHRDEIETGGIYIYLYQPDGQGFDEWVKDITTLNQCIQSRAWIINWEPNQDNSDN